MRTSGEKLHAATALLFIQLAAQTIKSTNRRHELEKFDENCHIVEPAIFAELNETRGICLPGQTVCPGAPWLVCLSRAAESSP